MSQMQGLPQETDGAIIDGVSPSIKATVFDLPSANPVAVAITDSNGDQITTLPVSADSLPLPTGAATEATLSEMNDTTTASSGLLSNINDTLINQAGSLEALGAAAHEEDQAHTTGDVGMFMLGLRNSTLSTTFTNNNGDYNPIATDGRGAVWVMPGVTSVDLGKAEDAQHTSGDTGVFILGVRNDTNAIRTTNNNDYNPISTDASGNTKVVGDIAHDSVDGGTPIKVGGKARTANPAAVANADRTDAAFDDLGRLVVVKDQVRDLVVDNNITITNSVAEATLLAAGAAGVYHDLKKLVITNSSAVAVSVTLKEATGGATRMIIDLGVLGANSSFVSDWDVPMTQGATAQNWTLTLSALGVTVHAYVQAVKNV